MKHYKNTATDEVFGFDETDETQLPFMQSAIDSGFVDVSGVWPPKPSATEAANASILEKIAVLEAKQTPRRSREAVLGVDNGWLKNLNDQIAALRAQLTKE